MKKNILVLALIGASFGAYAQGLGDLKKAAKEVDVEAVKTTVKEKTGDASTAKGDQITGKVADAINVDKDKVDAVAKTATDAAKKVTAEKIEKVKTGAEEKLTETKEEKSEIVEEVKEAEETKVVAKAESVEELKAETEAKEALKAEKKANLLSQITALGTKIAGAETKLGALKESGASEEEVSKKASIIEAAKEKLAALTASFK